MKSLWMDIYTVDKHIILTVYSWRGKELWDKVFCYLSKSGDGPFYIMVVLSLYFCHFPFADSILLAAVVGFSIELPLYKILKKFIKRKRPFERIDNVQFLVAPPDRFSFPSGHTAAAFLMWFILSSFYPWFYFPGLIWASLIGFSRVYLCVHYPTDIFAGIIVGIISAKLGIWFV